MALRPVRAAPNFASILDMPVTQIERPRPMPEGTYLMQIKGQPEIGKSSQKGTDQVKFTYLFIQAADDVNADELAQSGGCKDKTVSNNTTTFYLTEKSHWRLLDFLAETLGIPTEDEDGEQDPETGAKPPLSLRQMLAFTPNRQFYGVIKHVHPKERPNETYMEISQTANLEAGQADEQAEGGEYDEAS